jgi:hypothetical protein
VVVGIADFVLSIVLVASESLVVPGSVVAGCMSWSTTDLVVDGAFPSETTAGDLTDVVGVAGGFPSYTTDVDPITFQLGL